MKHVYHNSRREAAPVGMHQMTARDVPVGLGLRAPRGGRHRRRGSDRVDIGANQDLGSGDRFMKLIEISQIRVNMWFLQRKNIPIMGL